MKQLIILSFLFLLLAGINQKGHAQIKNCNGPFQVNLSSNETHTFDEVLSQLGIATLQEFNSSKPDFDMVIGGTLLFDKPNQEIALYGTRIKMLGNANINVRNTTTLTLDNAYIYGCGTMWKNIDVLNGTINTRNDCTIEDAVYAINARSNSKIDLQSTLFKNNLYGASIGGPSATNIQVSVSDCTFTSDNNFLSSHPIAVGISVVALDYVDLSPKSGQRNTFQYLHNGIISNAGSVRVSDCDFYNITVSSILGDPNSWQNGGYGIHIYNSNSMSIISQNTFSGMHTAIRSNKANINAKDNFISSQTGISLENVKAFSIADNDIFPSEVGIQVNSTFSYIPAVPYLSRPNSIANNTIDIYSANGIDIQSTENLLIYHNIISIKNKGTGIFVRESNNTIVNENFITVKGGTDSVIEGIYLESCDNVEVTDNDIKQVDFASCCIPLTTGIYSENTFGSYSCNKIYGESEYSWSFTKAGMEFLHMCDNSRLTGNEFKSNSSKDLVLASEDFDVPTIIGSQGDFNNLKGWGNKWTGMSGGSAYNYSDDYINSSRFLVNGSVYLPVTIVPSTGWFEDDPLVTNESPCADTSNVNNGPIYDCTDLITKIIMIDTTRKFDVCQKAIWKYHYFKKLLRMKKLNLLSPACLSFLNAYNNNDLVKIAKVDSAVISILINRATDSLLYANILNTQAQLNNLHDQGLVFSAQYQQTMALYSQLLAVHGILMDAEQAKDILKADSVKNVIATINVTESCLQLLLGVLNVQLDYIKSDTLTPAQKTNVNGISQLCPIDMGEAVYIARSLRSIYDNVSYFRIEECAPARVVAPRSSENTLTENKLNVYPNPAYDELNIAFNAQPNEKGTISITDMNGRLIKKFLLEDADKSLKLNVSDFNSGLYFIKYISHSGVESIEKFVISK
jgi:hypothetical protein